MTFSTLMYHEIRERWMLHPEQPYPIEVRQDYHDNLPAPLFISLENFQEQMEYLYENHYHTLTLSEIIKYYYEKTKLPEKSILLTFDDCFQSVSVYAYPVLKKYHFHAVAFVVTGWLNKEKKPFDPEKSICLTAEELENMTDVFEYANHTDQFHTRTNTALSMMMETSDSQFSEDLDRCNEHHIIHAKNVFAYPFGLYTDRNIDLLKNKDFLLAFTSKSGINDRNVHPLLLKRNVVPYFMSMEAFRRTIY